jgi:tetratricopeptide (TPR) repeat protein
LLAQVLLLYREKDYTQAANAIESIAENPGALQPIALMTQALIQAKREKEKDAKQAMQASIKLDRSNPYCRWLRAQLALTQKQTTIAETEWKALAANPNFFSAANRRLAINFAQRSKKTPGDANRAVLAATKSLQSDDTKATWFAHYVLAIALYTAGKTDEAIESLDKAVELAKEDQLERCASLRKAIDAAEIPDFDF